MCVEAAVLECDKDSNIECNEQFNDDYEDDAEPHRLSLQPEIFPWYVPTPKSINLFVCVFLCLFVHI